MRITKEAPVAEPQTVERAGPKAVGAGDALNGRPTAAAVEVRALSHSFVDGSGGNPDNLGRN